MRSANWIISLSILASSFSSPALATRGDSSANFEQSFTVNPAPLTGRSFVIESTQTLPVIDDLGRPSSLLTAAGTDITVIETKNTDRGELIHLGVNSDTNELHEFWMTVEDFARAKTVELNDDSFAEEAINGQTPQYSYAEIAGKKKRVRRSGAMTYCYRIVKMYLLKTKKVKTYLGGVSAWMAADELPKHGFKNLGGVKPSEAQVGDVCVYRGGKGGNGHAEVLTAQGWYYGYGYKSRPISKHPFIACFRK